VYAYGSFGCFFWVRFSFGLRYRAVLSVRRRALVVTLRLDVSIDVLGGMTIGLFWYMPRSLLVNA